MTPNRAALETAPAQHPEQWCAVTLRGDPISIDRAAGTARVRIGAPGGKREIEFEVEGRELLDFLGRHLTEDTILEGVAVRDRQSAIIRAGRITAARLGPGTFVGFDQIPNPELDIPAEVWANIWQNLEDDERDGE